MEANLPKRKNLRLKYYDYSQAGYYFITICTQDKKSIFGEIRNEIMIPNHACNMVGKWIQQIEYKYENIKLDQYIIMPNHLHCIISIVGDDPCVVPNPREPATAAGTHIGVPLQTVIQWFKTMTTNEYIRGVKEGKYPRFDKQIWQRNYYEHVIRNDKELHEIREYIVNNPLKWHLDKYYNL